MTFFVRRSKTLTACLAAGLVMLGGMNGVAQEEAGTSTVAAEDLPAEVTSFTAMLETYTEKSREITAMLTEAQTATPARQAELQIEFTAARDALIASVPALEASAIAALEAAPNRAQLAVQFIQAAVQNAVQSDRYENALRLSGVLIDAGHTPPGIHEMMGIAMFGLDDFAGAKREFDLAKASGTGIQSGVGTQYAQEVDGAMARWERETRLRAAEAEADDLPRVKLVTSKGELVIELYENEAPNTVANFVHLVEEGFYNETIFHRVLPMFMAQGGDPTGTGSGGPGWSIRDELEPGVFRHHFRGTLSMAHAGPNTGGSQFFLTFRPTPHLDGVHTVFGRVVEGLDVLADLQRRDPTRGGGPSDSIVEASVVRKRAHDYIPEKGPSR